MAKKRLLKRRTSAILNFKNVYFYALFLLKKIRNKSTRKKTKTIVTQRKTKSEAKTYLKSYKKKQKKTNLIRLRTEL